jgi:hypothetical protein
MPIVRVGASVLAVIAIAIGAPACGKANASARTNGIPGKAVKPLGADLVPSEVLDLKTAQEDVSKTLAGGRRSYVSAASVYSFRKDNLLEATLQVSRFLDGADWQSLKFRQRLVTAVGGVQATLVRVGDNDVYLTAANQQRISIWFKGPYMFILATREDYEQPRALVRKTVEINP